MSEVKTITTKAGTAINVEASLQPPLSDASVAAAVDQLQQTVNELITRFNAHTHTGVTVGAGSTGAAVPLVQGVDVADTDLFTP